ncbi:hypothetical protein EDD76_101257 [Kineothrix alysoides]|uniref:Uncharacterized protein n=1 Tax=Kineothrix alysoides TaxID=1469948 RepID=A0A4R1R6N2_9FIRM|nr:hypothetical protein [Kineothrix alysoides]TCL61160.1 hypothetical protein EDD76_101257 [Kineothrix alysoides]
MEDKIRAFLKRRFLFSGIFEARTVGNGAGILQCVFVGMILAFSLSLEMHRLDADAVALAFPGLTREGYQMLSAALGILIYPLTIVLNLIFTAMVSGMAMMLNYGAVCRFSYGQFFRFISYAATVPAILASAIGAVLSVAFVYLVYNFGSVLFALFIFMRKQNRLTEEFVRGGLEEERIILAESAKKAADRSRISS